MNGHVWLRGWIVLAIVLIASFSWRSWSQPQFEGQTGEQWKCLPGTLVADDRWPAGQVTAQEIEEQRRVLQAVQSDRSNGIFINTQMTADEVNSYAEKQALTAKYQPFRCSTYRTLVEGLASALALAGLVVVIWVIGRWIITGKAK